MYVGVCILGCMLNQIVEFFFYFAHKDITTKIKKSNNLKKILLNDAKS